MKSNYAGHEYWICYRMDLQRPTLLMLKTITKFELIKIFYTWVNNLPIKVITACPCNNSKRSCPFKLCKIQKNLLYEITYFKIHQLTPSKLQNIKNIVYNLVLIKAAVSRVVVTIDNNKKHKSIIISLLLLILLFALMIKISDITIKTLSKLSVIMAKIYLLVDNLNKAQLKIVFQSVAFSRKPRLKTSINAEEP
ncbi:hypothetical protein AGLY_014744 [Aphis glycines]|uniref:Uncharacterized protein n=1 Tax=Aphis glycines TaxID=307491 RepID=A0A6G0T3B7_APHGL|nr:hypothetical protein AGLY_014744 [Aphis glycines]